MYDQFTVNFSHRSMKRVDQLLFKSINIHLIHTFEIETRKFSVIHPWCWFLDLSLHTYDDRFYFLGGPKLSSCDLQEFFVNIVLLSEVKREVIKSENTIFMGVAFGLNKHWSSFKVFNTSYGFIDIAEIETWLGWSGHHRQSPWLWFLNVAPHGWSSWLNKYAPVLAKFIWQR